MLLQVSLTQLEDSDQEALNSLVEFKLRIWTLT